MPKAIQLPSGSWRCQAYLGRDASGKQIRKSYTASTKKEAERLAINAEFDANLAASQHLLSAAAHEYIDERRGVLAPSTITTYERILRNDLAPIADLPISSLDNSRVQTFVSDHALTHSPKSTRCVYGLLSAIIGRVLPNVRLRIKLPPKVPNEITIPDRDEIDLMIAEADPLLRTAIILSSSMGLRRAEICALTWADTDGISLYIRNNLSKGPDKEWKTKSPKTAAGKRVLPIPPAAAPCFLRPEDAKGKDRILPLSPDALTRRFERLCARLDMHYRFHSLRHYYASVLLSLGIPDKYAMARMGHATPTMLKQVYQHLMSNKQDEVTDQLAAYFSAPQ